MVTQPVAQGGLRVALVASAAMGGWAVPPMAGKKARTGTRHGAG